MTAAMEKTSLLFAKLVFSFDLAIGVGSMSLSRPCLSPGQEQCVLFLGKTPYSHCTSLCTGQEKAQVQLPETSKFCSWASESSLSSLVSLNKNVSLKKQKFPHRCYF